MYFIYKADPNFGSPPVLLTEKPFTTFESAVTYAESKFQVEISSNTHVVTIGELNPVAAISLTFKVTNIPIEK